MVQVPKPECKYNFKWPHRKLKTEQKGTCLLNMGNVNIVVRYYSLRSQIIIYIVIKYNIICVGNVIPSANVVSLGIYCKTLNTPQPKSKPSVT